MEAAENPLTSAIAPEVPLPNAPLVRVIAQVRFPPILSIEKRDFVAPFQEAIRNGYPILRPEKTQGFVAGPGGMSPIPPQTTWRFTNADGDWKVSLTSDFLALETTKYTSRDDFFARFTVLLQALVEHINPKVLDRIGVRYIDRVSGNALNDIHDLVRTEMLGIVASPVAKQMQHALSDSLFLVPGNVAQIHARWGRLPAGHTADPAVIEPDGEPSWILDLDMFRAQQKDFDADDAVVEARSYAERIYTFFRWAITDKFLQQYGGKV